MNWSSISAVADLIAALAVIISLVYVAYQIRLNTRESRLSAQQTLMSELGQALQNQASSTELATVIIKGLNDLDSLNQVEKFQFFSQMGHLFRLFEALYFYYLEGSLDSNVWKGYEFAIVELLGNPGALELWALRKNIYSRQFQDFIEKKIS